MYNRYIRNDNGSYTRIPQEDPPRTQPSEEGTRQENRQPSPEPEKRERGDGRMPAGPSPSFGGGPGHLTDGLSSFLRHVLDQLHLDHVDTGDLLLLILLFFLFREDADEELLVSLGLLLIL
nr:hypothetical protein [uncultured Oscillibacter sp.]